jgi:hypothetical protein
VAEYFNVDPVIVRIAAVVLLFSGPGAFAYILAWIFVPEERGPVPYGAPQPPIDRKDRGTQIFGIVLLALAVSLIWGDWWSPARRWLFPLGLMGLGAWLLLRRDQDDDTPPSPPAVPPSPPTPPAGAWAWGAASTETTNPAVTAPASETSSEEPPSADDTTTVDELGPPAPEDAGRGDDGGAGPPTAPWDVPPPPVPVEPPQATARRRRVLGPIVFGALLIWSGLAFLADVSLESGLAGALLILGVGFVLGSFVGGSRVLILPALVVGAALVVTAVIDIPLNGPIGDQAWAPQRIAEVAEDYEVSIGEGTLDLSALDIPAGDELAIEASVGLGHLVVLVPEGMAADVTTDVGAGESQVFDLTQDGVGVTTDRSVEGSASSGTLTLDLTVGMGKIEVRRVLDASPTTTTTTETTSTTVLG